MFADPLSIIKQFGVTEGMHIADIGAGSGHYVLALAPLLRTGKVYAIDIQRELLDRIKAHATAQGSTNVEILWANAEKIRGTKLADSSLDALIISNVLFQIEDKDTFAEEMKRILKPAGRVLVIDWTESFQGMGPAEHHVFSKGNAVDLFTRHGFSIGGDISAGAHHYGIIVNK